MQGHQQSRGLLAGRRESTGYLGLSEVVFRITQSMTTKKRMGERIHPCLTPDFTGNHSEVAFQRMMLYSHSSYLMAFFIFASDGGVVSMLFPR